MTLIEELGPHVVRYHAILRRDKDYIPQFEYFDQLEYIIFDVLRSPLNKEAIRHYALQGNKNIIVRDPNDIILHLKERQSRYSSLGFDYLVLPLSIQMRRLRGVPLSQLSKWEFEIEEQHAELQDPNRELPKYEDDPNLPVINEWVGLVGGDRCDVIGNILSAAAEDKIIHTYQVNDEKDKEFFNIENRKSKLSCKFSPRFCLDFDCSLCHEFIKLLRKGIFYLGEKLDDINIAQNRYDYREIKKIQQILSISALTLESASLMTDASLIEHADEKTLEVLSATYKKMLEISDGNKKKEETTEETTTAAEKE